MPKEHPRIKEFKKEEYILGQIIDKIEVEFRRASKKFPKFNNAHEGYAVLLEEVDELWENVKLNQSNKNRIKLIKNEAIHVAAMVVRILYDCCGDDW